MSWQAVVERPEEGKQQEAEEKGVKVGDKQSWIGGVRWGGGSAGER